MRIFLFMLLAVGHCLAQPPAPHLNAHAHNDYVHPRPLRDGLASGFISVEADVHLQDGQLLVSHDRPTRDAKTLEQWYLHPLDSMVARNGYVYPGVTFYLMIDLKTEGEATYQALKAAFATHASLLCRQKGCAVKVFVSGERPLQTMLRDRQSGLAIDGRPEDVGKGYTVDQMPVISDTFSNWSKWSGQQLPTASDFDRIRALAQQVHAEGKKLRLYGIPDHEVAWQALLNAGVDLINTDRLVALNDFLQRRGL